MSWLFQNKIEPKCAYCARSHSLGNGQVICAKKGVMSEASHCRAFQYDPLRRTPPRPLKAEFPHIKHEDFTL